MKKISIILPVYMEADNIETAVENTLWALNDAKVDDYEIMIIDCKRRDGTDDGTPALAEEIAKTRGNIMVFHNDYMNLGAKYWMGVDNAKFPYVALVASDNELAKETLRDMLLHLDEADIITSYAVNPEVRPMSRRLVSRLYTFLINISAGLNLHYYNGTCIHKTDDIRRVKNRDEGLTYMADLLVTMIKSGSSFIEVPITLQQRGGGKSSVLTVSNAVKVGKSILRLFWRHRIMEVRSAKRI